MLPSTGYFKGINCPFYDSGLCERPYCHFRHVKKEPQNESIESGAILQKLVSAAVQKVLQQTDGSGVTSPIPASSEVSTNNEGQGTSSKPSYNPTPISELNKINSGLENNEDKPELTRRHIPIPYTPRKPIIPIKRTASENGEVLTIIPPAEYSPGSESAKLETYTPTGSTESTKQYLPGKQTEIQQYIPNESKTSSKHNYVPSDKTTNKKKILEYKPVKLASKNDVKTVTYQPTPKSLVPCFSSDEDEPEPKKSKLSNDLNGLDDLGPEFDILDQILDEEKGNDKSDVPNLKENKLNKLATDQSIKSSNKTDVQNVKENKIEKITTDHRSKSKTKENKDSKSSSSKDKKSSKNKSEIKEKSHVREIDKKSSHNSKESSNKNDKKDKDRKHRSKSTERKSSHKKSSHDKDAKKDKSEKSEKKHSNNNSNETKSSKSSSKHSSNSKHDTKHKSKHKSSHDSKENHKKDKEKSDKNKDIEDISHDYEDLVEDELEILSESDEESIAMECKRIFEEYVPTAISKTVDDNKEDIIVADNDEYVPSKKRISRTTEKNIKITPKPPVKPDFKVSAAQAMAERLSKVKEYHAAKKLEALNKEMANKPLKPDIAKYFSASSNGNAKVRIAHVPYASTLVTAKKEIQPNINSTKTTEPSTSSTAIQTVKKGAQRVAHVPSDKFIDRPGVLEPLASKIPANIRSTYLNMMIDHCLKIYINVTDAYARAQHEELATSKKCSTVQIYKNSAVLAISRLKKELQECNGVKKSGSDCTSLNKTNTANSNTKPVGSWSIESKNKKNFDDIQQYTGAKLYHNISKWILTEEQLVENGFPRPHSSGEKGRAIIVGKNKQKPPKGYVRTCCRCKKDYTVDKKGFAAVKEECIYHPNNKYRIRGEVRYQCCSQDGSSDGCCIASSHVYEYVDFDNLKGFVRTMPPDGQKDDYGVYSLDCEMCYTTHGLDLTRITVINSACKVIYETLIKPLHPIIDYNTRYSGITEEQMAEVKTTLLDVQATLLSMFNSKTILIGHSLESDFKALKLIHDTVVDTSVLFPHKMGPPYKRALRNLSSEYLRKIIQNSVDGHDSAEDATVCMELILYKLKEDLKTR
ncbi:RNA exonuclease 1 homolog [Aricia agestis]|uniref:RNA exonuclease 1 homolog n=1 Tax=Aricia agestis TaxID=91739 RepID=UPI001C203619|nr:RNA exonuclease 1 homolog [Aricia agestis]